ncbi:hypothetical protein BJ508DRAFT_315718 [Ascobolus immersus RN42]|uniref:CENP-V/GFA domain-containing protein n=1 Tax=Ascobolus immersus RN42 TaxID=1160509 RepID=A0A3N4HC53_ASCIM|nr:hypothetical protein BJ508DRAFT_315718 [Ascobolus immersus RN42]
MDPQEGGSKNPRAPSVASDRSSNSRSPTSAGRPARPTHHHPQPYRAEDIQTGRYAPMAPESSRRSGEHNIPGVYRDHHIGRTAGSSQRQPQPHGHGGKNGGSGHMTEPHTPGNKRIQAPDFGDDALPPISGHCLCGDFAITLINPRPGMIMCHCFDCQVNSASFFGTYVSAESMKSVLLIPSQRDDMEHEAELTTFDAIPEGQGGGCPRTYCRSCCTMLYAEPSSIGIVAVNASLFQNHTRHPAFQLGMEIFTERRVKWLKPMPGAIQSDFMPNLGGDAESTDADDDQMDAEVGNN